MCVCQSTPSVTSAGRWWRGINAMERAHRLPLACPKHFHASPWFGGKNGGLVVVERRRARQEGRKPVISPAESALPSRVGRWLGLA